MNGFIHILKYKLISFLKFDTKLSSASIFKTAGSVLVYGLFTVGAFFLTRDVIAYLLTNLKIGTFLLHRFISIILFIFFISVNIGNVIVSYSTLYKSNEVAFLLSKPLEYYKIFTVKFLDNFFYSSATLLLIIFAVLSGYGKYFQMEWWFYPLSILFMIIPFMFTAASLGVIVLMIIMKLAARFGGRKVLITFAVLYLAGTAFFFQYSSPVQTVKQVMAFYPDVNRYFSFLDSGLTKALPNFWIGNGLYWISGGRFYDALPYIIDQIALSALLFSLAVYLGKRWYFDTWKTSLGLNLGGGARKAGGAFLTGTASVFQPQEEALLKKEYLQFFREPSQWIHLSVILVLIAVFVSSSAGIDIRFLPVYNLKIKTIIYLVIFLFNVFLISALTLRFVYTLVSIEGEAYWKIRSAPVSSLKFVLIKIAPVLIIIFVLGQVLNYFSQLHFELQLQLTSSVNIACVTIAMVMLNFGMGNLYSNFKEKNPIRIASSQGASITFLLMILYMVFLIAVMFYPVYNYFTAEFRGALPSPAGLWKTSLYIGAVSAVISLLSFAVTKRSMKKDL